MTSASSLERELACPDGTLLPHIFTSSEYAERGTCLHRFGSAVLSGVPRAKALVDVPEKWRHTAEGFDPRAALAGCSSVRAEVAYAVNVKTGAVRELGQHLNRAYRVSADEIPGTLDVAAVTFDDWALGADWKFGHENVAEVAENLQLTFAAYVRAEALGEDAAEGRVIYVREDGKTKPDTHRFSRLELDGFLDKLARLKAGIDAARLRRDRGEPAIVAPGPHCRYCPAMATCPAHVAIARRLLPDIQAIDAALLAMTPEQAGMAWAKLSTIKALVDHAEEGLKNMARQAPIPLPDGRELRELRTSRTNFVKARAIELLKAKGATTEELASCESQAEVPQVREVAKPGAAKPRKRSHAA